MRTVPFRRETICAGFGALALFAAAPAQADTSIERHRALGQG